MALRFELDRRSMSRKEKELLVAAAAKEKEDAKPSQ